MSESKRPRTEVRRVPGRGRYDRDTIHAILDAGLVAHVGIADDGGQPFVLPMAYARDGNDLLLHGSRASRLMQRAAAGAPLCITVTLLDALVLARSAFHHSMNYRSVVVLGRGRPLEDPADRTRAFTALVEHMVPGRAKDVRMPDAQEDAQTLLVAVPLAESSAKVRTGPPVDEEADYALPVWAGELPFDHGAREPVPDPRLEPGTPMPSSVTGWTR